MGITLEEKNELNIHNEAMDLVVFARLGYDPRDKDRVYIEVDKITEGCFPRLSAGFLREQERHGSSRNEQYIGFLAVLE